ncbi:MAG: UMP kinase, partial [Rhodothermales bacterium]
VDGVFTSDPEKDPSAQRYVSVHGNEVIKQDLRVMDMTAFTLCKESGLSIIVFNINQPGNLLRVMQGEQIGTLVHWNETPKPAEFLET